MKDWYNLEADENWWLDHHYTSGRIGTIDKVVIHHNAGVLSIADCYNTWQTRPASAHYQVDKTGRIGQFVHDWDTAWHAGGANSRSIGIEHANCGGPDTGWAISEATVENGAHLVAAVCLRYGLGRPAWLVNVFPHQYFMSTACPGQLSGVWRDHYMSRAQAWYDAMANGREAAPAVGTPSVSTPPSIYNPNGYDEDYVKHIQQLLVNKQYDIGPDGIDGVLGEKTHFAVMAFQNASGLVIDGIPGPETLAKLEGHEKPIVLKQSSDIRAIQNAVGATPDNVWGPDTDKRVDVVRKASVWGGVTFPYGVPYTQAVVRTAVDGIWGDDSQVCHDRTVIAIQKAVGADPDGIWGEETESN